MGRNPLLILFFCPVLDNISVHLHQDLFYKFGACIVAVCSEYSVFVSFLCAKWYVHCNENKAA